MASGENLLVGLVSAALAGLIARRILRGVQSGRLPLYRTYLHRNEAPAKFNALIALHVLSLALIAFIAADLLLGLGFRSDP